MVRMQPAAWHRNASQKQMSLLLFSVDLLCELQLAQLALGIELLHSMMFRSGLGDSGCSSHELHHWLSLGKSFAASRGRGFQRYWQRIATPCKKHVGLLATQCTERERESMQAHNTRPRHALSRFFWLSPFHTKINNLEPQKRHLRRFASNRTSCCTARSFVFRARIPIPRPLRS